MRPMTLETFHTCDGNRLAALAAKRIEDGSGREEVSVFYGGPGCGKSHLLAAISHGLCARSKTVVTPKLGTQTDYTQTDALVIDDLHQAIRLDAAWTANVILVATSQRIPIIATAAEHPGNLVRAIEIGCAPLLSSLAIEIGKPDVATSRRILRDMITSLTAHPERIADDTIEKIAPLLPGNGHALLGAARRLATEADLLGHTIDPKRAVLAISGLTDPDCRRVTLDAIRAATCQHFNLKETEILSPRRARDVARPRQVGMFLGKMLTSKSLPEIGRNYGRDHTTVIHAHQKVTELMESDADFRADVLALQHDIMARAQ